MQPPVEAFPGNQIPSEEINSMGQKLANLYPLPNINCTMPCNNYLAQVLDTITTDNETFRVDDESRRQRPALLHREYKKRH